MYLFFYKKLGIIFIRVFYILVIFFLITTILLLKKPQQIFTDSFIKEISEIRKLDIKNDRKNLKNLNALCLEKNRGIKDKKGRYVSNLEGFPKVIYKCKNELLHGEVIFTYVDEKSKAHSFRNFNEGRLQGKSYFITKDAKIYFEGDYLDGSGGERTYYTSGKIKLLQYFKNFRMDSDSVQFYENGNIQFSAQYRFGEIVFIKQFSEEGFLLKNWLKKKKG